MRAKVSGRPRTVLVVEDEAPLREVLRDALEGAGFAVVEAHDPDGALAVARSQSALHLALLDVMVPGTDAGALAARLQEAHAGLKVLYISGYSAEAVAGRLGDSAGIFLEKPFTEDELLRAVHALLDEGPSRTP